MSLAELAYFQRIQDAKTLNDIAIILRDAKAEGYGEHSSVYYRAQSRKEVLGMQREMQQADDGIYIVHKFGRHDNHGDVTLDATDAGDEFRIWMDQSTGRDRDNYASYDECEMNLNEDEARELHLALTIWLEART